MSEHQPFNLPTALEDKVEGLECELDSALGVIYRHGDAEAQHWMWLNYPKQARALALSLRKSTAKEA